MRSRRAEEDDSRGQIRGEEARQWFATSSCVRASSRPSTKTSQPFASRLELVPGDAPKQLDQPPLGLRGRVALLREAPLDLRRLLTPDEVVGHREPVAFEPLQVARHDRALLPEPGPLVSRIHPPLHLGSA